LDYVKALNSGAGLGGYHDWRLANRKELFSLVDFSRYSPALPTNHPFENVLAARYWSSSTYAGGANNAWDPAPWYGILPYDAKSVGFERIRYP
jgi:hypothetical protein